MSTSFPFSTRGSLIKPRTSKRSKHPVHAATSPPPPLHSHRSPYPQPTNIECLHPTPHAHTAFTNLNSSQTSLHLPFSIASPPLPAHPPFHSLFLFFLIHNSLTKHFFLIPLHPPFAPPSVNSRLYILPFTTSYQFSIPSLYLQHLVNFPHSHINLKYIITFRRSTPYAPPALLPYHEQKKYN